MPPAMAFKVTSWKQTSGSTSFLRISSQFCYFMLYCTELTISRVKVWETYYQQSIRSSPKHELHRGQSLRSVSNAAFTDMVTQRVATNLSGRTLQLQKNAWRSNLLGSSSETECRKSSRLWEFTQRCQSFHLDRVNLTEVLCFRSSA
jgi:hypothetical protein